MPLEDRAEKMRRAQQEEAERLEQQKKQRQLDLQADSRYQAIWQLAYDADFLQSIQFLQENVRLSNYYSERSTASEITLRHVDAPANSENPVGSFDIYIPLCSRRDKSTHFSGTKTTHALKLKITWKILEGGSSGLVIETNHIYREKRIWLDPGQGLENGYVDNDEGSDKYSVQPILFYNKETLLDYLVKQI